MLHSIIKTTYTNWRIQRRWSELERYAHIDRLTLPNTQWPCFVQESLVVRRYFKLFGRINWHLFPRRQVRAGQWPAGITPSCFMAACLIKLDQGFTYMSQLRRYLVEHPALVWWLGFPLVLSRDTPWGFDTDASLPTARHFTRLLRQMPNQQFQILLDETVRLLHQELATEVTDFGQSISLDTKHIIAWVKENNPKAYVKERYDKEKQPAGDPDCRLGCKRRRNYHVDAENTPATPKHDAKPASTVEVSEYYWGYASGVVATKVPDWGEYVLAEWTQPFNCSDISYFFPLMEATERRLGFRPAYGAFDMAFDAFYVYEYFHPQSGKWEDGFAAVPLSKRQRHKKTYTDNGEPICEAGLIMPLKYTFMCSATLVKHERAHYMCPLKKQGEDTCPINHKRWKKSGCTHRIPTSIGAKVRHKIDREGTSYKSIYKQRTATERINSQAVALGIERPKLRNRQAISNQNTLTYVLINLRALQKVCKKKAAET